MLFSILAIALSSIQSSFVHAADGQVLAVHDHLPPLSTDIETAPSEKANVREAFGPLPLYFIENQGQLDEECAFYVQGSDKTLYFTADGVTFSLHGDEGRRWNVKMVFAGADPEVKPQGEGRQEASFSYFRGRPEDWKTGCSSFSRITYANLWPGIDLVFLSAGNRLKYEFTLSPGADPSRIRLSFRGVSRLEKTDDGSLRIRTPVGSIEDGKPIAFQEIDGERREVGVEYALLGEPTDSIQDCGFVLEDYNPSRPLVIDPEMILYCGYIGGGFWLTELITDVAIDGEGNLYATGSTQSSELDHFPVMVGPDLTLNGDEDAFVAKVDASGSTLLYCGYIGGQAADDAQGIAVDGQGNAYIAGCTDSSEVAGFPVKVGPDLTFNSGGLYYFGDAFVAKVNASGDSLDYCGYIGAEDGTTTAYGIAVDDQGHAYATGYTNAEYGFPVVTGPALESKGSWEAYVAKVDATGAFLDYCGFIGGNAGDYGIDVAVDAQGNAYVTGRTASSEDEDFPVSVGPDLTFNGYYDAFVAKVNDSGQSLDYCGYVGGEDGDSADGIAVDKDGNAYITGETISSESEGFPVIQGPDLTFNSSDFLEGFVAKIDASGGFLHYCGYIGGESSDDGDGIAVDGQGCAYVTGSTYSGASDGFPVRLGPDLTFNGGGDCFVAKVAASGIHLEYCGYLGGSWAETALGIAVDGQGDVYIAGETESTEHLDFPVKKGPDLTYNGGMRDAFVAKIAKPSLAANTYDLAAGTGGSVAFR